MNEFIKTIILAIISGLAASLASPIVNDFIQNKRNLNSRKQRILDSVTDKISKIIVMDPIEYGINENEHAHLYKSSNQLEAMGEIKLAEKIRKFVETWGGIKDYNNLLINKGTKLAKEITSYKL